MEHLNSAYVAGLLDGEGCFCIYERARSSPRQFRGEISVGMVKPQAIEALHNAYGGHMSRHPASHRGWADQLHWKISNPESMLGLIEDIKPFVLVKQSQVLLLEEFCRFRVNRRRNAALSRSDMDFYIRVHKEMKLLNVRGS